jgi:hypothetical protein
MVVYQINAIVLDFGLFVLYFLNCLTIEAMSKFDPLSLLLNNFGGDLKVFEIGFRFAIFLILSQKRFKNMKLTKINC